MRPALRAVAVLGVMILGSVFGTPSAKAQGFGHHHHGYSGGYGGGYSGGGYGVPSYGYYGNGGHDFAPHGHTVQTPIGGYSYYGNGAHDYRPHLNVQTPYGVMGYSGGFFSNTQSYSPPTPYGYQPW